MRLFGLHCETLVQGVRLSGCAVLYIVWMQTSVHHNRDFLQVQNEVCRDFWGKKMYLKVLPYSGWFSDSAFYTGKNHYTVCFGGWGEIYHNIYGMGTGNQYLALQQHKMCQNVRLKFRQLYHTAVM